MKSRKGKSFAVWACGAPATGKSRICESAVLPLGFELIDVDETYENLLLKYKLNFNQITENSGTREHTKAIRYARRLAERLSKEAGSDGVVEPDAFIANLDEAARTSKLRRDSARLLIDLVRSRAYTGPIPSDSFRKAVFPLMSDLDDPLDFLDDKEPVTRDDILAVAREITRRRIDDNRGDGKDLLIVETGGQTGKLLNLKAALEAEGYQTFLLWFYLERVEDAQRRNDTRKTSGGHHLEAAIIQRSFEVASRTRDRLIGEFLPNALEIDNTPEGDPYIRARIKEVNSIVRQWTGT